ncbi:Acyl-CoA N-acyltransferase [Ascosphaera apis ARSEF 7405]|uniref:Glucosamine 6-phosphate N-acetyltransferase n=1 Tax=Ascosphaera apis ARSEF 7405 TaxID=392613 RepID=A0A168CCB6_9EURO|nr:Acyl-CoA N-acyltransferase [Ascosphaera apis ARSEF 7405]
MTANTASSSSQEQQQQVRAPAVQAEETLKMASQQLQDRPEQTQEQSSLSSPTSTTTTPADSPLFSTTFISPEVQAALPEGYTLRPLHRSDFYNSYLDVLRVLTTVGEVSYSGWSERYDWMKSRGGEYFPIVICDDKGKVVGTGTLLVERKFIHSLGSVGHIEDIAVDTHQQGKRLGLRLIQALDYVAEKAGCYKTILDCSEHNEGFYIKCGFKRAGLEMAHYY